MLAFKLDDRSFLSLSNTAKGTQDLQSGSGGFDFALPGQDVQAWESFKTLDQNADFKKRLATALNAIPEGVLSSGCLGVCRQFALGGLASVPASDFSHLSRGLAVLAQPEIAVPAGLSYQDMTNIRFLASSLSSEVSLPKSFLTAPKEMFDQAVGASPQEAYYRGNMFLVDAHNPEIERLTRRLMDEGVLDLKKSNQEIANDVLAYIQAHFDYKQDDVSPLGSVDHWQRIEETVLFGRGDCEDLAILQASLLGNVLQKKGYDQAQVDQMVTIAAGYMVKDSREGVLPGLGHAVVKFQDFESGRTLALDATDTRLAIQWDQFGMREVFELNGSRFLKFQEIDSTFQTALRSSGITSEQAFEQIRTADEALRDVLRNPLDIPTFDRNGNFQRVDPATNRTYTIGSDAPAGVSESIVQGGKISGDTRFFTVEKRTLSGAPPGVPDHYFTIKMKKEEFADYFTKMREGTNKVMLLFTLLMAQQDELVTAAMDIYLPDEDAAKQRDKNVKEHDGRNKKMFSAIQQFYQKLNVGVQQVLDEMMNFLRGGNQTQFAMMRLQIEYFGQENPAAAIGSELFNEATGMFEFIRTALMVQVAEAEVEVSAFNTQALAEQAYLIGDKIDLLSADATRDDQQFWVTREIYRTLWGVERRTDQGFSKEMSQSYLVNTGKQVKELRDILLSGRGNGSTKADYETVKNNEDRLGKVVVGNTQYLTDNSANSYVNNAIFSLSPDTAPNAKMGVLGPAVFVDLNTERSLQYRSALVGLNNFLNLAVVLQQTIQAVKREIIAGWSGRALATSGLSTMQSSLQDTLSNEINKQTTLVDNLSSNLQQLTTASNSLIKARIDVYKATVKLPLKNVKFALNFSIMVAAPLIAASSLGLFAAIKPLFDAIATGYNVTLGSLVKAIFSMGDLALELDTPGFSRPVLMQNNSVFNDGMNSGAILGSRSGGSTVFSSAIKNPYSLGAINQMGAKLQNYFYDARSAVSKLDGWHPAFFQNRGDRTYAMNGFKAAAVESASRQAQQFFQVWLMGMNSLYHVILEVASSIGDGKKLTSAQHVFEGFGESLVSNEMNIIQGYQSDTQMAFEAANMGVQKEQTVADLYSTMSANWIEVPASALGFIPGAGQPLLAGFNTMLEGFKTNFRNAMSPYAGWNADYQNRSLSGSTTDPMSELGLLHLFGQAKPDELKVNSLEDVPKVLEVINSRDPLGNTRFTYDSDQSIRGLSIAMAAWADEQERQLLYQTYAHRSDRGGTQGGIRSTASNQDASNTGNDFREVNYETFIDVNQKLQQVSNLRLITAMLIQSTNNAINQAVKDLGGSLSPSDSSSRFLMSMVDQYNQYQATMIEDFTKEYQSRVESHNAWYSSGVSIVAENTALAVFLLVGILTPSSNAEATKKKDDVTSVVQRLKLVASKIRWAGFARTLTSASIRLVIGLVGLGTVRDYPTINSRLAGRNDDARDQEELQKIDKELQKIDADPNKSEAQKRKEKASLEEKKNGIRMKMAMAKQADKMQETLNKAPVQGIKIRGGGKAIVNKGAFAYQKSQFNRQMRSMKLMTDIQISMMNQIQSAAEDINPGSFQSARSWSGMRKILAEVEKKGKQLVEFSQSGMQNKAETINRSMDSVKQGLASFIAIGLESLMDKFLKPSADRSRDAGASKGGAGANRNAETGQITQTTPQGNVPGPRTETNIGKAKQAALGIKKQTSAIASHFLAQAIATGMFKSMGTSSNVDVGFFEDGAAAGANIDTGLIDIHSQVPVESLFASFGGAGGLDALENSVVNMTVFQANQEVERQLVQNMRQSYALIAQQIGSIIKGSVGGAISEKARERAVNNASQNKDLLASLTPQGVDNVNNDLVRRLAKAVVSDPTFDIGSDGWSEVKWYVSGVVGKNQNAEISTEKILEILFFSSGAPSPGVQAGNTAASGSSSSPTSATVAASSAPSAPSASSSPIYDNVVPGTGTTLMSNPTGSGAPDPSAPAAAAAPDLRATPTSIDELPKGDASKVVEWLMKRANLGRSMDTMRILARKMIHGEQIADLVKAIIGGTAVLPLVAMAFNWVGSTLLSLGESVLRTAGAGLSSLALGLPAAFGNKRSQQILGEQWGNVGRSFARVGLTALPFLSERGRSDKNAAGDTVEKDSSKFWKWFRNESNPAVHAGYANYQARNREAWSYIADTWRPLLNRVSGPKKATVTEGEVAPKGNDTAPVLAQSSAPSDGGGASGTPATTTAPSTAGSPSKGAQPSADPFDAFSSLNLNPEDELVVDDDGTISKKAKSATRPTDAAKMTQRMREAYMIQNLLSSYAEESYFNKKAHVIQNLYNEAQTRMLTEAGSHGAAFEDRERTDLVASFVGLLGMATPPDNQTETGEAMNAASPGHHDILKAVQTQIQSLEAAISGASGGVGAISAQDQQLWAQSELKMMKDVEGYMKQLVERMAYGANPSISLASLASMAGLSADEQTRMVNGAKKSKTHLINLMKDGDSGFFVQERGNIDDNTRSTSIFAMSDKKLVAQIKKEYGIKGDSAVRLAAAMRVATPNLNSSMKALTQAETALYSAQKTMASHQVQLAQQQADLAKQIQALKETDSAHPDRKETLASLENQLKTLQTRQSEIADRALSMAAYMDRFDRGMVTFRLAERTARFSASGVVFRKDLESQLGLTGEDALRANIALQDAGIISDRGIVNSNYLVTESGIERALKDAGVSGQSDRKELARVLYQKLGDAKFSHDDTIIEGGIKNALSGLTLQDPETEKAIRARLGEYIRDRGTFRENAITDLQTSHPNLFKGKDPALDAIISGQYNQQVALQKETMLQFENTLGGVLKELERAYNVSQEVSDSPMTTSLKTEISRYEALKTARLMSLEASLVSIRTGQVKAGLTVEAERSNLSGSWGGAFAFVGRVIAFPLILLNMGIEGVGRKLFFGTSYRDTLNDQVKRRDKALAAVSDVVVAGMNMLGNALGLRSEVQLKGLNQAQREAQAGISSGRTMSKVVDDLLTNFDLDPNRFQGMNEGSEMIQPLYDAIQTWMSGVHAQFGSDATQEERIKKMEESMRQVSQFVTKMTDDISMLIQRGMFTQAADRFIATLLGQTGGFGNEVRDALLGPIGGMVLQNLAAMRVNMKDKSVADPFEVFMRSLQASASRAPGEAVDFMSHLMGFAAGGFSFFINDLDDVATSDSANPLMMMRVFKYQFKDHFMNTYFANTLNPEAIDLDLPHDATGYSLMIGELRPMSSSETIMEKRAERFRERLAGSSTLGFMMAQMRPQERQKFEESLSDEDKAVMAVSAQLYLQGASYEETHTILQAIGSGNVSGLGVDEKAMAEQALLKSEIDVKALTAAERKKFKRAGEYDTQGIWARYGINQGLAYHQGLAGDQRLHFAATAAYLATSRGQQNTQDLTLAGFSLTENLAVLPPSQAAGNSRVSPTNLLAKKLDDISKIKTSGGQSDTLSRFVEYLKAEHMSQDGVHLTAGVVAQLSEMTETLAALTAETLKTSGGKSGLPDFVSFIAANISADSSSEEDAKAFLREFGQQLRARSDVATHVQLLQASQSKHRGIQDTALKHKAMQASAYSSDADDVLQEQLRAQRLLTSFDLGLTEDPLTLDPDTTVLSPQQLRVQNITQKAQVEAAIDNLLRMVPQADIMHAGSVSPVLRDLLLSEDGISALARIGVYGVSLGVDAPRTTNFYKMIEDQIKGSPGVRRAFEQATALELDRIASRYGYSDLSKGSSLYQRTLVIMKEAKFQVSQSTLGVTLFQARPETAAEKLRAMPQLTDSDKALRRIFAERQLSEWATTNPEFAIAFVQQIPPAEGLTAFRRMQLVLPQHLNPEQAQNLQKFYQKVIDKSGGVGADVLTWKLDWLAARYTMDQFVAPLLSDTHQRLWAQPSVSDKRAAVESILVQNPNLRYADRAKPLAKELVPTQMDALSELPVYDPQTRSAILNHVKQALPSYLTQDVKALHMQKFDEALELTGHLKVDIEDALAEISGMSKKDRQAIVNHLESQGATVNENQMKAFIRLELGIPVRGDSNFVPDPLQDATQKDQARLADQLMALTTGNAYRQVGAIPDLGDISGLSSDAQRFVTMYHAAATGNPQVSDQDLAVEFSYMNHVDQEAAIDHLGPVIAAESSSSSMVLDRMLQSAPSDLTHKDLENLGIRFAPMRQSILDALKAADYKDVPSVLRTAFPETRPASIDRMARRILELRNRAVDIRAAVESAMAVAETAPALAQSPDKSNFMAAKTIIQNTGLEQKDTLFSPFRTMARQMQTQAANNQDPVVWDGTIPPWAQSSVQLGQMLEDSRSQFVAILGKDQTDQLFNPSGDFAGFGEHRGNVSVGLNQMRLVFDQAATRLKTLNRSREARQLEQASLAISATLFRQQVAGVIPFLQDNQQKTFMAQAVLKTTVVGGVSQPVLTDKDPAQAVGFTAPLLMTDTDARSRLFSSGFVTPEQRDVYFPFLMDATRANEGIPQYRATEDDILDIYRSNPVALGAVLADRDKATQVDLLSKMKARYGTEFALAVASNITYKPGVVDNEETHWKQVWDALVQAQVVKHQTRMDEFEKVKLYRMVSPEDRATATQKATFKTILGIDDLQLVSVYSTLDLSDLSSSEKTAFVISDLLSLVQDTSVGAAPGQSSLGEASQRILLVLTSTDFSPQDKLNIMTALMQDPSTAAALRSGNVQESNAVVELMCRTLDEIYQDSALYPANKATVDHLAEQLSDRLFVTFRPDNNLPLGELQHPYFMYRMAVQFPATMDNMTRDQLATVYREASRPSRPSGAVLTTLASHPTFLNGIVSDFKDAYTAPQNPALTADARSRLKMVMQTRPEMGMRLVESVSEKLAQDPTKVANFLKETVFRSDFMTMGQRYAEWNMRLTGLLSALKSKMSDVDFVQFVADVRASQPPGLADMPPSAKMALDRILPQATGGRAAALSPQTQVPDARYFGSEDTHPSIDDDSAQGFTLAQDMAKPQLPLGETSNSKLLQLQGKSSRVTAYLESTADIVTDQTRNSALMSRLFEPGPNGFKTNLAYIRSVSTTVQDARYLEDIKVGIYQDLMAKAPKGKSVNPQSLKAFLTLIDQRGSELNDSQRADLMRAVVHSTPQDAKSYKVVVDAIRDFYPIKGASSDPTENGRMQWMLIRELMHESDRKGVCHVFDSLFAKKVGGTVTSMADIRSDLPAHHEDFLRDNTVSQRRALEQSQDRFKELVQQQKAGVDVDTQITAARKALEDAKIALREKQVELKQTREYKQANAEYEMLFNTIDHMVKMRFNTPGPMATRARVVVTANPRIACDLCELEWGGSEMFLKESTIKNYVTRVQGKAGKPDHGDPGFGTRFAWSCLATWLGRATSDQIRKVFMDIFMMQDLNYCINVEKRATLRQSRDNLLRFLLEIMNWKAMQEGKMVGGIADQFADFVQHLDPSYGHDKAHKVFAHITPGGHFLEEVDREVGSTQALTNALLTEGIIEIHNGHVYTTDKFVAGQFKLFETPSGKAYFQAYKGSLEAFGGVGNPARVEAILTKRLKALIPVSMVKDPVTGVVERDILFKALDKAGLVALRENGEYYPTAKFDPHVPIQAQLTPDEYDDFLSSTSLDRDSVLTRVGLKDADDVKALPAIKAYRQQVLQDLKMTSASTLSDAVFTQHKAYFNSIKIDTPDKMRAMDPTTFNTFTDRILDHMGLGVTKQNGVEVPTDMTEARLNALSHGTPEEQAKGARAKAHFEVIQNKAYAQYIDSKMSNIRYGLWDRENLRRTMYALTRWISQTTVSTASTTTGFAFNRGDVDPSKQIWNRAMYGDMQDIRQWCIEYAGVRLSTLPTAQPFPGPVIFRSMITLDTPENLAQFLVRGGSHFQRNFAYILFHPEREVDRVTLQGHGRHSEEQAQGILENLAKRYTEAPKNSQDRREIQQTMLFFYNEDPTLFRHFITGMPTKQRQEVLNMMAEIGLRLDGTQVVGIKKDEVNSIPLQQTMAMDTIPHRQGGMVYTYQNPLTDFVNQGYTALSGEKPADRAKRFVQPLLDKVKNGEYTLLEVVAAVKEADKLNLVSTSSTSKKSGALPIQMFINGVQELAKDNRFTTMADFIANPTDGIAKDRDKNSEVSLRMAFMVLNERYEAGTRMQAYKMPDRELDALERAFDKGVAPANIQVSLPAVQAPPPPPAAPAPPTATTPAHSAQTHASSDGDAASVLGDHDDVGSVYGGSLNGGDESPVYERATPRPSSPAVNHYELASSRLTTEESAAGYLDMNPVESESVSDGAEPPRPLSRSDSVSSLAAEGVSADVHEAAYMLEEMLGREKANRRGPNPIAVFAAQIAQNTGLPATKDARPFSDETLRRAAYRLSGGPSEPSEDA
jgi:hypothetical protein